MHQGFVGGPQGEGVDNVGVHEDGHLVALSLKAHDLVPQSLVRFLPTIVKVSRVFESYTRALEIFDENLFQVRPALDAPRDDVFELGLR
jgi:hypothetical protein